MLKPIFLSVLLGSASWLTHASAAPTELQLPSFGEASAGLISPSEEYELGQKLIRRYRGGLPTSTDPFIEGYLRQLVQKMAYASDLSDKRFDLLVLDNPTLNAFAAPGGIVGVNTGALLVAQTEQQLASIIAHELAHLSQRHYARRLQQQQTTSMASYAAILAGILVAAASNSDSGYAVLPAIQAAAIEKSLRFSRQMEQEADRIGMDTLTRAGYDAEGMPEMFEQMLKLARFRSKVPEFLLTHPITESRISDSASRAARYPKRAPAPVSEQYQLMRARVMLHHESSPQVAVKRFTEELNGRNLSPVAARYGLVLAKTQAGQLEDARKELAILRQQLSDEAVLAVAEADIAAAEQKYDIALATLRTALADRPNSHPLNVRYAELLMAAGQYSLGESVLQAHVKRHPDNAYVWYLLAEVHGLAGHILEVHKARAEYFILNGIYDKAEIQLRNALRLLKEGDRQDKARIEQRLLDVRRFKEEDI